MASNKKKTFVTQTMARGGRALLAERDDIELIEFPNMISAADFEALLKTHAPVHGVALGATRFGETELEAAKDMKVVTRIGVGYDAVDVPALSRRNIPLMVVGIANSPSVAEQALFMMLMLAKRANELHALVKDGQWSTRLGKLPYDLFGKTVLIIGFGRIGTRTAKRCLAMEMNVLVYDPYLPAAEIRNAGYEAVADLDAALPRADFVSIHCPKTPETIERDFFSPQPRCHCELLFDAEVPVGIANWFYSYATFATARKIYLADLFVKPSQRGKGLGKALLAHLAGLRKLAQYAFGSHLTRVQRGRLRQVQKHGGEHIVLVIQGNAADEIRGIFPLRQPARGFVRGALLRQDIHR